MNPNNILNTGRRTFLKKSSAAAIGTSISAQSWSKIIGTNSDIRVAVVGLNGNGRNHLKSYIAAKGVRLVAICDVDTAVLDRAVAQAAQLGTKVDTYVDLRELLQRDDIDAVSIATPNHQHAIQAIWTMQAGKHVLLEKPATHNLWEGKQIIAAAKKYNKIAGINLQNRSSIAIADAIKWQKEGHIGKVTSVRALCYKRRTSLGKSIKPVEPPKTVNYDLYQGPAPLAPIYRKQFHYDWHWQWNTGNGDICNQGNHQLDVARRFLGNPGHPSGALAIGGRLGYHDDGETPNTYVVKYNYTTPLIYEQRGLPAKPDGLTKYTGKASPLGSATKMAATMDQYKGLTVGNVVECEGGYILVPKGRYELAQAFDKKGVLLKEFKGIESHYENFINAIRAEKASMLKCSLQEGHLSSSLGHMANISFQTGKILGSGEILEKVKEDDLIHEPYSRLKKHLDINKLDLKDTPIKLGATLSFDAKNERFVGENSAIANTKLSRDYRTGFEVPELI